MANEWFSFGFLHRTESNQIDFLKIFLKKGVDKVVERSYNTHCRERNTASDAILENDTERNKKNKESDS